eukprot:6646344-Prymnesium_polylepis.1
MARAICTIWSNSSLTCARGGSTSAGCRISRRQRTRRWQTQRSSCEPRGSARAASWDGRV